MMDLLYISRSSAVRPTLQTLALVQSSASFSQHIFGLPLFLWHYTIPSSINFFNVWFRLHVRNNLFCLFNKVPDLTPAIDWFLCVLFMIPKIFSDRALSFIFKCIYAFRHVFSGSTFHVHVTVGNMHVHIMRCLILLFVAFHSFTLFMIC